MTFPAEAVDSYRRRYLEAFGTTWRIRKDDVAGLAVCLAAPAGSYLTGQTIAIDGDDIIR
jgi:NAD(P)-dependent dehydrogenase (short-subunit alcohol dehydrogenase family)